MPRPSKVVPGVIWVSLAKPEPAKGSAIRIAFCDFELGLDAPIEPARLLGQGLIAPARSIEAQALAGEGVRPQLGGIAAFRPLPDAGDGLGILARIARQDIEAERGIAHASGDRAHHVAVGGERHHPGIGHEAHARLDADEPLGRGGVLDRAAGFLGKPQHGHAGCHRRRRAGAAGTGRQMRHDGIQGGAGPAVIGMGSAMAQNRDIGLAEHHGARGAHPRDYGRVEGRKEIHPARLAMEQRPSGGGGKPHHVHRILDHHRHAGQRPQGFARGAAPVDGARIREGVRIEEDDRVVARIVGGNPIEAGLGSATPP